MLDAPLEQPAAVRETLWCARAALEESLEGLGHRERVIARRLAMCRQIAAGQWWRALPMALWQQLAPKATPAYLGRKLIKTLSKRFPDYRGRLWTVLRRIGILPYAIREQVTEWPDRAQALETALQHPLPPVPARSQMEYVLAARYVKDV